MDFSQWRQEMLVIHQWNYLNHAAVGPLPSRTVNMLKKQIDFKAQNGAGFGLDESLNAWNNARKTFSQLLGVTPEHIATPLSTLHSIAIALDAIRDDARDKKTLILNELEFTTNSYPYQVFAKQHNLDIHVLPSTNGELPFQAFEEAITSKTLLIGISHVQFSNGFKTNLSSISKLAHDYGAYVFVDAIQSMGTTPIKAKEWELDFLGGSGFKWLLGPYGAAIAYFNPNVFEDKISVASAGWWSAEDFKYMSHHPYQPARDARRFQSNIFPNVLALEQSVRLLLDVGIERIEHQIHDFHDIIIRELQDTSNVIIKSPIDKDKRGPILLLDTGNAQQHVHALRNKNIRVSLRNGMIRVAPHGYNTKEEIQEFVESLKEILS